MVTLLEEARLLVEMPDPAKAKAIRESAGISLGRLAEELGISHFTLMRWEAGATVPQRRLRLRYARVLADLRSIVEAA